MSTNTDDVDDEYLDDPISLMGEFEIKKEPSDEDEIIDIQSSSDEEETYTSSYGKKNFVLSVTFFDNTRNIRLLNKCKPMSINIVDCKQYPTYYTKIGDKSNTNPDESSVGIENKCNNDSENKPNSADAQSNVLNNSVTVQEANKKQEGEKKRRGAKSYSFYEKLKKRKEFSKQNALNCKDLSQVDFKRNTGLVGLKITDAVFKQIINKENVLIRTKKNLAENKTKESNDNGAVIAKRNESPEERSKETLESSVEKGLNIVKNFENTSKESKQSDMEIGPIVTKSTDSSKDKFWEKRECIVAKTTVENQSKRNTQKDIEKTSSKTKITFEEHKEKSESNMYIKEVGAVLDNLGTTIMPVPDTHVTHTINDASNNVTVTDSIGNKSINTHKHSAGVMEKLRNHNDIEMRCSLKIPNKKFVEKVLKLKKVKSHSKSASDVSKSIVQQSPKEAIARSQTAPNLNIKSSERNIDGTSIISGKDNLQCKSMDTNVAFCREANQVTLPVAKDSIRKDKPGSKSPVIPCTTIPIKTGLLKSTQNIPSPKFSGHNAIIFRRPPPPLSRDFATSAPPNRGQPIQTPISHGPQYQPMPHISMPRFRLPPPYPPPPPNYPLAPPNYPLPPPNFSSPPSFAQIRPHQALVPPGRIHLRGIGMGLNSLRFAGPRFPACRPPLPVPPRHDLQTNLRPLNPAVNKDSFIGSTANGDPIKKINIFPHPPATDTAHDKQMMLAELNSAMMSPELINKPEEKPGNDLKRKAGPKPVEPVEPKYSKPCPLSKKTNVATKIPDNPVPNTGYSPPILPIWTYEEALTMFAKKVPNINKGVTSTQNLTPTKMNCKANIIKVDNKKHKRTHTDSEKRVHAKKISFEDYRKRSKGGAERIDVDKIRKHNESKNVTDDYNQDLGYDSDSTVKF